MERIQHDLVQGTDAWHAFRLEHDGASEAPAMLGLSRYMTRNELLRQKATGIAPEVDSEKQGLFNAGHAAEAAARPLAEDLLSDELYPATWSYGRMSASTDGLTMDGETAFEHKLYRADLADAVKHGNLPDEYMAQCQQILHVTGADRVLFMVSDGTRDNCETMFVEPDAQWFARIKVGWQQFHRDLADYKPVEVIPAAVAAPTMQLPALSIQVTGSIALVDNLKVFGERLESFISAINKNPSDDQAFADAEAAIKTLGTAETALEAAKASALAQTASIDEMTRTVALYAAQARTTRLMLTKLVKDRKESIRGEIVSAGFDAFAAHVAGLNKRIGKQYVVLPRPEFGAAIKGKKTVASLHDAVDTMLAQAKIAANEVADRIEMNMKAMDALDPELSYTFLFSDAASILLKANDDFLALAKMRISEHKAAEAARIEAEAEKARERIRAEEAAKAKAEQERIAREEAAKVAKEQAENTRRLAEEAKAKEQATAQEQNPKPHGDPESGPACKPASAAAPILGVEAEVEEALNDLELWYERYGELFDLQPISVAIADFLFPRG